MKKHHRARTENFPRAASFQLPRQISHSPYLVFTLFQIVFSLFLCLPSLLRTGNRDENAELANFPQKCSFPADGLSPLADTSSSAGGGGKGRGGEVARVAGHPPFSSRVVLPAGWKCGKSCENFFVNSEKVEDDSKERPAQRRK